MSTAWFTIVTRLGLLLWLATDHFILLILGALLGLAVALAVGSGAEGSGTLR